MFASKDLNANSGCHYNAFENIFATFLTRCVNCGHGYTYSRERMNKVMRCSICQKFYVACNIGDAGVVPPSSSTAGEKESQGAAKKRRKEFKNVFEVAGTKRDDNGCKQKAEDYTQLQKKMDEMEKRIKQQEELMHDFKRKMVKPTHVKPDSSDFIQVKELAVVWRGKIRSRSPGSSSVEVLDFLQFIGAYRLQNSIINQEETAGLASSIAHYKQAPALIQSLGLNHLVPEFVEKFINRRVYIPAVRLICFFKLKGFSPLHLLKKEITKLRNKTEAEVTDGWQLRDILELMADYKLEIDIPGELLVKLMDFWPPMS